MVLWHPRLRVHIAAQMAALAISPTHRSFLPLWTQEILSKAGHQGLFPQPVNAAGKAKGAEDELAAVLASLDPQKADKTLWTGQAAWEEYRRLQAEFRSGIKTRFPLLPMVV